MRLRVGIAGCGIGKGHVAAYKALPDKFEVAALCDIDVECAQTLAAQEGIPLVTGEFASLCARPDLDIVDVCRRFRGRVRPDY